MEISSSRELARILSAFLTSAVGLAGLISLIINLPHKSEPWQPKLLGLFALAIGITNYGVVLLQTLVGGNFLLQAIEMGIVCIACGTVWAIRVKQVQKNLFLDHTLYGMALIALALAVMNGLASFGQ